MSLINASQLEANGQYSQALDLICKVFRCGGAVRAEELHVIGRLHHRLGNLAQARRAYSLALLLDCRRPRTFNNLALLELGCLNAVEAERWLMRGLTCQPLPLDDEELLQATACDLRLFQLRPVLALAHVEYQLGRNESARMLTNRAVCMQKLARLPEAVVDQELAIRMHLAQHAPSLVDVPLVELVGQPCADLPSSMQLQIQLMNLAIYKLSLDSQDSDGLRLLLAGTSLEQAYWQDQRMRKTRWDGSFCDQLIIWDDQGFGDTLQNLRWIPEAARRVGSLRIWLRPALMPLVKACMPLPVNCKLEVLNPQSSPWGQDASQIAFFFLPIVLKQWPLQSGSRASYLQLPKAANPQVVRSKSRARRIGLVWSAGRHKAPQPERNARVRDVPKQAFFDLVEQWKKRYQLELVSLQLEGHDEVPVLSLIQKGVIEQPLCSPDWLETAVVLESLDLLVSVDTSVAHLAGGLGVPTILLLSAPADWRWGQHGLRTFLYDSMKLVRCTAPGDWSQALQDADQIVGSCFGKPLA